MIYVCSYNAKLPVNSVSIDSTSRSRNWTRDFSPFKLGPIELYDGMTSKNFENAWQFSKVYEYYTDDNGEPSEEYWKWAKSGWADVKAHRYPMGRGAIPKYSLWDGEKLGYIDARKKIYIPLYSKEIKQLKSFSRLRDLYVKSELEEKDLYLRDFDGYNHKRLGMSYDDVINCESRKMGHGFIIAMLLDSFLL